MSEAVSETSGVLEESPLDFEAIAQADLQAIRKKAESGKPLSESEVQRLRAAEERVKEGANPAALEPVWAKSQVELAKMLGCSRKQIARYLKIDGDDAPPAPAADGRYNVTAWKMWAAEHGKLRGQTEPIDSRHAMENRQIELRNEKLEIENAVRRGELLHIDDVCRVLIEMVSGMVDTARAMKHSLAPRVVGLTVPEATKRIGQEVDQNVLTKLSLGEWAKKKVFWSKVSAQLSDLHRKFSLGDGLSGTS